MKQKILAVLMIIAVLLCFMPTMAFAQNNLTNADQIGKYYEADDKTGAFDSENEPTLTGTTEQVYENGQVRVNKEIKPTGTENVFDVTLSVTTKDVEMQNVTSEDAAVVLVIDTSGSMEGKRIQKAKEAAQAFVDDFKNATSGAKRKIAIVSFSGQKQEGRFRHIDSATTVLNWADASNSTIPSRISSLRAVGGTNLEAGLQLAYNLLQGAEVKDISNKNIIVLTDGKPTYGIGDLTGENSTTVVGSKDENIIGNGYPQGTSEFHKIHTQVENLCGTIQSKGIRTYAVYVGDDQVRCDDVGDRCKLHKDHRNGISGSTWLGDYCNFTTFSADDADDLSKIFTKISEIIRLQAQAWKLTDPMGEYIVYDDTFREAYAKADSDNGISYDTETNTLRWDLTKATDPGYLVSADKTNTYSFTYRIKLNNLKTGFNKDKSYAANGTTSLTYLITKDKAEYVSGTAYFNIPSVKGYVGDFSFKKVDETGKALPGATFTLTTADDSAFVRTAISDENGKVEFTDIPSGHNYTLAETTSPTGYTKAAAHNVTVSYGTVTTDIEDSKIANTPEKTSISVKKVWNDADDQDGIRPEFVTVQLLADGTAVGNPVALNEDNQWSAAFTDLPKAAAGELIAYTFAEVDVPDGYESTVAGDAENGFTITNTHTPETIDISGTKKWNDGDNRDGKRPDRITVRVLANGHEVSLQTVSATDGWAWAFIGLPKYEDGQEITYTVTEDVVADYTQSITGYDVTNTYTPEETSVTVTKSWNDQNDLDGIRPESVNVEIYGNGKLVETVTLSFNNSWTAVVSGLPKNADGIPINYTVKEVAVAGYTQTVTGDATKGFIITNTHEPKETEIVKISGHKIWDDNNDKAGKRPNSIRVNLTENGEWIASTPVTADNNWSWEFEVPQIEGTENAVYAVYEDPVTDYTAKVEGYNITNTYSPMQPETGNLVVSKSVSGDGADYSKAFTFTVRLTQGNEIVPEAVYGDVTFKNGEATFTLKNGESKTISGIPAGMNYTVTESDNEGYTVTVNNTSATSAAGTIAAGLTETAAFVNYKAGGYVPTPTPDVYPLTITKQVVGLDNVPADYAVTVTITNRYGTVVRTVTLKANETKTIYLSYGEYTLTETAPAVEGYTQSGQTFSENNFVLNSSAGKNVTVTNTYTKDAEKPPVDPKPTDPKPTNPATPAEPNKPDENPNNVPKTGDDMPISLAIYGIIAAGALLGIRKAAKRETK